MNKIKSLAEEEMDAHKHWAKIKNRPRIQLALLAKVNLIWMKREGSGANLV